MNRKVEADRDEARRQAKKAEKQVAGLRKSLEQPGPSNRREHEDRLRASATGPSPLIAPNVKLSGSQSPKRRAEKPSGANAMDFGGEPSTGRKSRKKATVTDGGVSPQHTAESTLAGNGDGENSVATTRPRDQWIERRENRIETRMLATLSREGAGQSLSCTIRDKSSSGAKIEIVPDKAVEKLGQLNSGDQLMLAFASSRERTTVECKIIWISGEFCGVTFCGPFQTENIRKQKSESKKSSSVQPRASKTKDSESVAGRLKRSIVGGR